MNLTYVFPIWGENYLAPLERKLKLSYDAWNVFPGTTKLQISFTSLKMDGVLSTAISTTLLLYTVCLVYKNG